jgi:THO complex subunit 2
MQEQERVANEEAERRLKAALTAKREPASNISRAASTNDTPNSTPEGMVEVKTTATESNGEDVNMEIDFVIPTPSSSQEASLRILDQV